MLVGIHKDPCGKFCDFLKRYEQILDYNGIEHIRLETGQGDFWEKVQLLDLFIFRWGHYDFDKQLAQATLPIIEKEMGIKCFPNRKTYWHYDDKIRQYYLIKRRGFPMIDSYIFWDKKKALAWVRKADFPVVFKLKGGAGGKNVILVKNKAQAIKFVNKMFGRGMYPRSVDRNKISLSREFFHLGGKILRKIRGENVFDDWQKQKNYVLFQKYLPDNAYDTRVTVIADRAFAFRRGNRSKDFRASGSGKLDYNIENINKRCLEISFEVSRAFGFQSMAYDFLMDRQRDPYFSEISYTFLDTAVYKCPGYWDIGLNWHEGHFWPQYFQLMDALSLPGLKQPKM